MGPFQRLATIAGLVCLVAFLLLASPGVSVVRAAGDGAAAASPGAPGTSDDTREASPDPAVERFVSQLRRQVRRAEGSKDEVVVLNNQGYNYRPMPGSERGPAAPATRPDR